MDSSPTTLTVIPARGGSKRIPEKNLRDVAGKPLIAHAIRHARDAEGIDRFVVSTDDEEIAEVSRQYGAEVPFTRPTELATDEAPMSDVITHAINHLIDGEVAYDIVCLIQTTSPLRTPADIDGALSRLIDTDADSAVSVSRFFAPPQWAVREGSRNRLEACFEECELWTERSARTQDLQKHLHPNGAVFAATMEAWIAEESFYTSQTVGYEMPPHRSFDIDELWELELVRQLLE